MSDPYTYSDRGQHRVRFNDGREGVFVCQMAHDSRKGGRRICRLTLVLDEARFVEEAHDFFEALLSIRRELEPLGLVPHCYGATLNAWPSGMARDMGSGLSAYVYEMGKPAKLDDLRSIFASGDDVVPATCDAQRAHYESWIADLQRRHDQGV